MAWDIGAFEYGASPTPVPGPTTPPSTTPPPGVPPDGPGGTGDVASIAVRASGAGVFVLARLFLDSGTEYEAKRQIVVDDDHVYEARLKEFGFVDRSIPVPSGLPQLGDCRIVLIDTDRKWRDLLYNRTPRRRLLDLRLVREGESESAYDPFATFEIYHAEFPAGLVEIIGRDITFLWIDRKISGLINRTNFPDLLEGIDEAFMPIIGGILDAPSTVSPPNPQGVLTLPRMTLSRWGAAQHPLAYVELCGRGQTEDFFSLINPADYDLTEEAHTIDGVDYTLSFIDFHSDQPEGYEVRYRIVEGFTTRGEFGGMPPVQNSPISGLRNPIDLLINVLYGVLKTETRIPRFNTVSLTTLRDYFNTSFVTSVSPAIGYSCDGAIIASITVREFLADWCSSFEVDLFVNRNGEITVNATFEEDPDRPLFSDGPIFGDDTDNSLISINSVRQSLANPTCNRLKYNFGKNYAEDTFQYKEVFDNEDDQLALGGLASPVIPFIEEQTQEYNWVRDPDVAEDVARRRMEFLALGSYRIEKELPLPEVFDDVELAKLYGVTHYGGLDDGGYHNTEFKTTGLTYNLDRLALIIKGILRVPLPIGEPAGTFSAQIPLEMLITGVYDDWVGEIPGGTNYYSAAVYIDPADYDGLVASHFQGCLNVFDNTVPAQVFLEDENAIAYALIQESTVTDYKRIRGTFTLDPVNPHYYRFRVMPGDSGGDYFFQDCKILIDVENSNRVKIQIPLTAGTANAPGPSATEDENNRGLVANYGGSFAYSVFGLPSVPPGALGDPGEHSFEHNFFLFDSSKWSGIESFELECIGKHFQTVPCGCAANCHVAYFKAGTTTMVSGSELGPWSPGVTAAIPERKIVTLSSDALDNLTEFEILHILNPDALPDGCRFENTRAALYVILAGANIKAQIYHKLSIDNFEVPDNPKEFVESRYLHEPTKYTAGTKWFHEVTGYNTHAGTGVTKCGIKDLGTTDVGTAGTVVIPSEIAFTGTRTRQRTAELTTLVDGNRYVGHDERSGTAKQSHAHQFLIAEVPAAT